MAHKQMAASRLGAGWLCWHSTEHNWIMGHSLAEVRFALLTIDSKYSTNSAVTDGIMWGYVTSCDIMWGHVRTCGVMWHHVRTCEVMRSREKGVNKWIFAMQETFQTSTKFLYILANRGTSLVSVDYACTHMYMSILGQQKFWLVMRQVCCPLNVLL